MIDLTMGTIQIEVEVDQEIIQEGIRSLDGSDFRCGPHGRGRTDGS